MGEKYEMAAKARKAGAHLFRGRPPCFILLRTALNSSVSSYLSATRSHTEHALLGFALSWMMSDRSGGWRTLAELP